VTNPSPPDRQLDDAAERDRRVDRGVIRATTSQREVHQPREVQAGRPGARLELMSGVDLHHHVVRFLWRLVGADGRGGERSIDVGEVDADGRLTKIVGFFGEPPKR
jgi:hypothetical protein